jgi:hypothetical protein
MEEAASNAMDPTLQPQHYRLPDLLFEAVMSEHEALLRVRSARALAILLHVQTGTNATKNDETMAVEVKQENGPGKKDVATYVLSQLSLALVEAMNRAEEEKQEADEVLALLEENPLGDIEVKGKGGRKRKGGGLSESGEKTTPKKVKMVDTDGFDYSSMSCLIHPHFYFSILM